MSDQISRENVAERKRKSREKFKSLDIKDVLVRLSTTEREILDDLCRVRGGVRGKYTTNEYIALLIKRDKERLTAQLSSIGCCGKCNDPLPMGCDGFFKGDRACYHHSKARDLML